MHVKKQYIALALIFLAFAAALNCAPGNNRWDQYVNPGHKAGFWAGIWHGLIIIITFIVSLFTSEVGIYEISNNGWPYNLGFVIGLFFSVGGGMRYGTHRRKVKKYDWDEISQKIEEKVHSAIKSSLEEVTKEKKEKEWEEIGQKIEEKIKKVLREWVEK